MKKFEQLVMLVLDGFGVASEFPGNAVSQANPKNINYLVNNFAATTLQASGPSVGLPWGERGNSEVGHLNLGAGRIVSQDLPRISQAIGSGSFFRNKALLGAAQHVKKQGSRLHLVGLVSSGGVHSAEEHVYALLALAHEQGITDVFVHMFTDGRDTAPKSALESVDRLTRKFLQYGSGKIATVTGRFYAMDRGGHWELTEKTCRALVLGEGEQSPSAGEAISSRYRQEIYDETIPPTVIVRNGEPVARISSGDAVIMFNFRPDRVIQLARALADPAFAEFSQKFPPLENMFFATMTEYDAGLRVAVCFPVQLIAGGLSETVSRNNLSQFHIAESEKYAHVTSFFNGGRDSPWPGEEREIVSSPAEYQRRYADVPAMSAGKVTASVIDKLEKKTNFILANYANCDMVGHTGDMRAAVAAVQAVDESIGAVFRAVMEKGAVLLITADHGNIEEMIEPRTGRIDKEHSLNPVPLIAAAEGLQRKKILARGYLGLAPVVPEGVLSDVSPTVLGLLGLPKPAEMTAVSLLPLLSKQTL